LIIALSETEYQNLLRDHVFNAGVGATCVLVYRNDPHEYWSGFSALFFTSDSSRAVDLFTFRCVIPTYQIFTSHTRVTVLPSSEQTRITQSLKRVAMRAAPKLVSIFISPYLESRHAQSPHLLLKQGKLVVIPIPEICDSKVLACARVMDPDDFDPFDTDMLFSSSREPGHVYVSRAGTKSHEAFRQIVPALVDAVGGSPSSISTSLIMCNPSEGAIDVSGLHLDGEPHVSPNTFTMLVHLLGTYDARDGYLVFPDVPDVDPNISHRMDYTLDPSDRISATAVNPHNNMILFPSTMVHCRAPMRHELVKNLVRVLGFISLTFAPVVESMLQNADEQYTLHHLRPVLKFDGEGQSPVYILPVTTATAEALFRADSKPCQSVLEDILPADVCNTVVVIQINDDDVGDNRDFPHAHVCGCVRLDHDGKAVSGRAIVPLPGEDIPSEASMVIVRHDHLAYPYWRAVRESAANDLPTCNTSGPHAHTM
jgi:hypothetical protein